MDKTLNVVISNEERDLAFSATYEEKISRLWLEMTIATQSLKGEGIGLGRIRNSEEINLHKSVNETVPLNFLTFVSFVVNNSVSC